jgi:hypothetical protein
MGALSRKLTASLFFYPCQKWWGFVSLTAATTSWLLFICVMVVLMIMVTITPPTFAHHEKNKGYN